MAAARTLPGRRFGRWAWAAAFAAVAVAALAVATLAASGAGPRRAAPAPATRRHTLPLSAQALISARIGASDPQFSARPAGNGFSLHGGGISALLSARGARVGGLTMTLAGLGRGRHIAPLRAPAPSPSHNRVAYRYPGASAWYAAGPLGIEQGFEIARPPSGSRTGAPLTLALAAGGALRPRPAAGALDFLDRSGRTALRYGGLEAVDATGHPLAATLAFAHGRLLIRVRDAGARYPVRIDPLFQLGAKITASGSVGAAVVFGSAVALSADGNTALIGGPGDNNQVGAAWIFARTGSTWTEQQKLVGTGTSGQAHFGYSAALSSDGNTALIGADSDGGGAGAAYVFTRSGTTWTQQAKLTGNGTVGSGEVGAGAAGFSVALAASGNLALVGAPYDNSDAGAVWTFVRSGTSWSQLGSKLVGPDAGAIWFGASVAVSGVGTTALVGATQDDSSAGAAFVYALSGVTWTEQAKLTGGGSEVGTGYFGDSVALSSDASTALVGGFTDNNNVGAAWIYTNAAWSQPGQKLVPSDESGAARFGLRVALSGDGSRALIGGYLDGNGVGAAWTFSRSGSSYAQDAGKLTGSGEVGDGYFGFAVGLSGDGSTALIGAPEDNGDDGAVWSFGNAPPTCSNVVGETAVGGGTTTLGLLCSGPVGAPLTYAIVKGPAHGVLGTIDQATGSVSYTPVPGFTGIDQFTYDATDADGASNVATASIAVPRPVTRLNPTIGYTISSSGTSFLALYLTGVPRAASVRVLCRGRHCPFSTRVEHVPRRVVCHGKGRHRRCRREGAPRIGTVTLTRLFRHHPLTVGARVTIDVTESGAIGKVYLFTIRRSRPPALKVSCLAPGSYTPGRGC